MSERRTHAAAGNPEFSEMWRNVSKLCPNKTQSRKTGQPMPGTATSPACNDFQSPGRRGGRHPHGDSPGDGEASQDIFWDSTSLTQAGMGHQNTRVVEISDIVNRIAPKNMKSKGKDSLLQWINDSAIPSTPEIPKPRVKKRSSRQSSVEDLMKLARQFDENMQQDGKSSEWLNVVNNNLNEHVDTCEAKPVSGSFPSHAEDPKCPSSSDRVEAELHAQFDCSTQRVSGILSEVCSQDIKARAVTSAVAEGQPCAGEANPAAHPAEQKPTRCGDFDDDWENDDLLNDCFVMIQNADVPLDAKPKTRFQPDTKTKVASVCKPSTNTDSALGPGDCKLSCSTLQELCPKPKTSSRSTFRLEPNPHLQPRMAEDVSKFGRAETRTGSNATHQKSTKLPLPLTATLKPNGANNDPVGYLEESSVKDISDSLWDDWDDDDALLYQVCDRVENSQPQQVNPSNCQENPNISVDGQKRTSEPLQSNVTQPIKAGTSASRQSACAFVRSKSLPETRCEAVYFQGWNIPMKSHHGMSQSFPGSSLGTFNHRSHSSGTFQAGNTNVDPLIATATQNSTSHNTAFKRNVSDSAILSSKVFITSQMMTGKCSASEIERKKQEALARRRLRLQNASKTS